MAKEVSLVAPGEKLVIPPNAIQQSFQTNGAGRLYSVIANAGNDRVPGKSNGYKCWYTHNDKSCTTTEFSYVTSQNFKLEINTHGTIPNGAISMGHENYLGKMYSIIAITTNGTIPGKTHRSDICEYEFGQKVKESCDFYWLIAL